MAAEILSGIQVNAEKLPFSVKGDGTHSTDAIFDHLKRCKAANSLTWHNNTIPEREVLNKDRPNSRNNTNVFCVFDAKDTRENLNLATSRYAEEPKTLQESKRTWDDDEFKVRIFAAGNYAYLCLWYGLSGASRHSRCLRFYITQAEIADWEEKRIHVPSGTLDNLAADHQRFMQEGEGNIKRAKMYNNVIAPVMFNVPVDQYLVKFLYNGIILKVQSCAKLSRRHPFVAGRLSLNTAKMAAGLKIGVHRVFRLRYVKKRAISHIRFRVCSPTARDGNSMQDSDVTIRKNCQ
ncbi:hypothetical protein Bbelb_084590 [Branchiostoma belcheri]|nr:hypothetical protein Bbelb_084590 [Branchiostoma belcheri]